MLITSVNNERIRELVKLKDKKYRDKIGLFFVEGLDIVKEAYENGVLEHIYILEGYDNPYEDIDTTNISIEVMKKISDMESISGYYGVCRKIKERELGNKILLLDNVMNIWPMIVLITVIVSSFRIAYLIKYNKKFVFHRELLALIFMIYILCLYYVVTYQDVNYGGVNLVPFKEMFRYSFGSPKFVKNVVGNILMFLPFGFFVSYYLKANKVGYPLVLTLIVSLTIELVQLKIGRVFDIDDVILNVIGGFCGFLIYVALSAIESRLPKFMKRDSFINFIFILILCIILIYSFNIDVIGWFR